jgi:septal ring factor EnvC (AmiA/AmiB activator)
MAGLDAMDIDWLQEARDAAESATEALEREFLRAEAQTIRSETLAMNLEEANQKIALLERNLNATNANLKSSQHRAAFLGRCLDSANLELDDAKVHIEKLEDDLFAAEEESQMLMDALHSFDNDRLAQLAVKDRIISSLGHEIFVLRQRLRNDDQDMDDMWTVLNRRIARLQARNTQLQNDWSDSQVQAENLARDNAFLSNMFALARRYIVQTTNSYTESGILALAVFRQAARRQ